jgi:hypothetical protein
VTFRAHGFQFRVPPNQIAQVVALPDGQTLVELSVDRQEFGALAGGGLQSQVEHRIICSRNGPPQMGLARTPGTHVFGIVMALSARDGRD